MRYRFPLTIWLIIHLISSHRLNSCCIDCCCSIDIWGIALNILLQDAPFLTFRLLIIIHYKIITYMNVFFTCRLILFTPFKIESLQKILSIVAKNTLVILLQLYRLYVVQSENKKHLSRRKLEIYHQKHSRRRHDGDIYMISNEKFEKSRDRSKHKRWERFHGLLCSFLVIISSKSR